MPNWIARERIQLLLTLAGSSAIVLLFVPFAYDYVPLRNAFFSTWLDPTWRETWPCLLLPWLVSAGHLRRLRSGRLPRAAQMAFLSVAVLAVVPFGYFLVGLERPLDWSSVPMLLCFAVPLASVAAFITWGLDGNREPGGLLAMQGIYVVQLSFWLLIAVGDFAAGAWLGVLALASYLVQGSLFAKQGVWAVAFVAGVLVPPLGLYLAQS
jgi:hypothetical protein